MPRSLLIALAAATLSLPASAAAVEAFDASAEVGFVDARAEGGPNYSKSHTWSANVHDFDLDGFADVLLVTHYQGASWLMHNEPTIALPPGRHFQEVQAGTFLDVDRHDCAWGDVNQDPLHLPDVYCTLGGERGAGVGPNELWIQEEDGSFVNEAREYGVQDRYGRGRHTTFLDVNHDAFPDLYVSNSYPRHDGRSSINKLFINEGGESFRRASGYGLDRELGGESVQAVDYDRDGWEDLLVCGKEGLHLYRNVRGERFKDFSRETGARGPCQAALLVKLDGNARPDLVRVAGGEMVVKLQSGGKFRSTVYARSLRFGQSLASGDVDGDGDQDLYVLQSGPSHSDAPDEPDLMLLNEANGQDYSRMSIPQDNRGRGDAVAAIDYDRNGLSDFIVLNGHSNTRGPVRMVAFRP